MTDHRASDKRYISTPMIWNQWPFCPLKRFQGPNREFGYIIAVEGQLLTVRNGNMFAAKPDDPIWNTYTSVDAILDDGWEVD